MVLGVSFIPPPSHFTSFSPYSFPPTDNKTTEDPALPLLWVNWGLPRSGFRSASHQGGIWGRSGPLGSTLGIQLRGKERGQLSPLKIRAPTPHPPQKGPGVGGILQHPWYLPWPPGYRGRHQPHGAGGAAQISTVGPETPLSSPPSPLLPPPW